MRVHTIEDILIHQRITSLVYKRFVVQNMEMWLILFPLMVPPAQIHLTEHTQGLKTHFHLKKERKIQIVWLNV